MTENLLIPPLGGHLHLLPSIKVALDQDWQVAVNVAAPNTPDHYTVRKVGNLYPPTGQGKVVSDYVAVKFSQVDSWQVALDWAKQQGLENTTPREVFAVAQQYPTLRQTLEQHLCSMGLMATTSCTLNGFHHTCYVCWSGVHRHSLLPLVMCHFGDGAWFLFRMPSVLAV